jgi:uncharacterized protein (TIGR02246 family)
MDVDRTQGGALVGKEQAEVRRLYQAWLDRWNRRSAREMAELLAGNGSVVGFDGSQMHGRDDVAQTLGRIFQDHVTSAYVGIVREVQLLSPGVALLRAVVGMVPPGQAEINPAVNAIQSLVGVQEEGQWRIALFQNTPAAFHGRPDLAARLTEELRQELHAHPLDG